MAMQEETGDWRSVLKTYQGKKDNYDTLEKSITNERKFVEVSHLIIYKLIE